MVVAAARIEGIYGITDDYPNKVPLVFAHQALTGGTLRVNANARPLDYIHVEDACRSLIEAMRQLMRIKPPAFRVFYVRTGRSVSLPRIARIVRGAAGTRGAHFSDQKQRSSRHRDAVAESSAGVGKDRRRSARPRQRAARGRLRRGVCAARRKTR